MWSRCLWIAQQESIVPWPKQHFQTRKNCVLNRKGYGTKAGGEGLEVFVEWGRRNQTRVRYQMSASLENPSDLKKKSATKIRLEVQGDHFL